MNLARLYKRTRPTSFPVRDGAHLHEVNMVLFEARNVHPDTVAQCTVTTGLNVIGYNGYEYIQVVGHADKGWTLRPDCGEWPYLIYGTRGLDLLGFHE